MSKPLFVETSGGFINLALVTHITARDDKTAQFFFSDRDKVDVPIEEARDIMRWWKSVYEREDDYPPYRAYEMKK